MIRRGTPRRHRDKSYGAQNSNGESALNEQKHGQIADQWKALEILRSLMRYLLTFVLYAQRTKPEKLRPESDQT